MMRIAMISDLETSGGAAVAATRLAIGLIGAGADVTRIVGMPDDAAVPAGAWKREIIEAGGDTGKMGRAARRMLPESMRVQLNTHTATSRLMEALEKARPDVINLHNIHGCVKLHDWPMDFARRCSQIAPTVWTLHDMWSFTGRCAYSYDCRKFLSGCDATCPTPGESPTLEPAKIGPAWETKRRMFLGSPELAAVTPSRWLAAEALAGIWGGHRVEVVPYGLPLDVYRPLDRAAARGELGVETRGPVLLIAAQDWNERRKGGSYLIEALRKLRTRPVTLLVMGTGELPALAGDITIRALGFIKGDEKKVLAYNAADALVHPAPVDNLPNVVLEAIACGTPVVGFPIGGVPDMVRPGQTGWLADDLSAESLAAAINWAIADISHGKSMRDGCRRIAESDYALPVQAGRYVSLFNEMLAARRPMVVTT